VFYSSVFFPNSNNSVRVQDDFMRAVEADREWHTRAVVTGEVVETTKARDLMKQIVDSAWLCGDPGLQFDTTINDWHTSPHSGRINASNPCSEYMFLDDTACNLASLNLMKFRTEAGEFDVRSFRQAARISIIAQDLIVDNAAYPTPRIAQNSFDFRPLGLGYANLGALLMARGLPYDSEAGRAIAGAVTAIMHGEAYLTSALLAEKSGPFRYFPENQGPFLRVIRKHRAAVDAIDAAHVPADMMQACHEVWNDCLAKGEQHGYKNSQVTVLAPTGTIGFMMDCDTTGVEPDIALVKYKKLVGGGLLKIVNRTVPEALDRLGYPKEQIKALIDYIDQNETIEGAPYLRSEHLPVFDCAFKPANGTRAIHHMGHVHMMGAVQPFLSGAISKTVNMPSDATPEEIAKTYSESWRLGLKAVAIYRDGCKRSQPLNTTRQGLQEAPGKPTRRRLPDERKSITHKFSVAGHEGYLTVGMYEDGTPGEIFIKMAKEGSTISGLMDAVATTTSISLQYGVPIKVLVDKFCHTRFEPSGYTNNPQIPIAKSIMDYVFRYLAIKFVPATEKHEAAETAATLKPAGNGHLDKGARAQTDAPACADCGAIMVPNGSCYKCVNCGATSGCS
jgi:ribonucleoside-diphosphate reductase alpha chain